MLPYASSVALSTHFELLLVTLCLTRFQEKINRAKLWKGFVDIGGRGKKRFSKKILQAGNYVYRELFREKEELRIARLEGRDRKIE